MSSSVDDIDKLQAIYKSIVQRDISAEDNIFSPEHYPGTITVLSFFFAIESEYNITFSEQDICSGKFHTIQDIASVITNYQLASMPCSK